MQRLKTPTTNIRTFYSSAQLLRSPGYGAVHILRQPPEGGEGVWQMLTIADEGGSGGKPKADHC